MAEKKAFVLRINKDLWDEIQRMAAEEFRSVNGQIEYILRESVRKRTGREASDSQDEKG